MKSLPPISTANPITNASIMTSNILSVKIVPSAFSTGISSYCDISPALITSPDRGIPRFAK